MSFDPIPRMAGSTPQRESTPNRGIMKKRNNYFGEYEQALNEMKKALYWLVSILMILKKNNQSNILSSSFVSFGVSNYCLSSVFPFPMIIVYPISVSPGTLF